jgi:hypothetical protein
LCSRVTDDRSISGYSVLIDPGDAGHKLYGRARLVAFFDRPFLIDHRDDATGLSFHHNDSSGAVAEGVDVYRRRLAAASPAVVSAGPEPDATVTIDDVTLLDAAGVPAVEVAPSSPLAVRVAVVARSPIDLLSLGFRLTTGDGTLLYETHTAWQGVAVGPLDVDERATVDLRFTAHLLTGSYRIEVVVTDPACRETLASRTEALRFSVAAAARGAGIVDLGAVTAVIEGSARRLDTGD